MNNFNKITFLKMKKLFIAITVFVFVSSSCKKSTDTVVEYYPLTTGSSWTYKSTPGNTYTLTVTNKDSVVNGRTYKVLSNSNGANNYQAKIGTDYYRYVPTNAFPGLTGLEELFLKDNLSVGTTWQTTQPLTIPGVGAVTMKLNYKAAAIGVSKLVSTVTYTDCIQVQLTLVASLGILGETAIGNGDFYYAKGIGLVNSTLNVNIPGQTAFNQTTDIISYVIK
jgi:hypothetical protein